MLANHKTVAATPLYAEKHRPQLHFSAPTNWLNDPNGLVWHQGLFHLFYQYNPTGNTWGNIHWGHAVSPNLIEWEHRPIALHAEPEGLGMIFSGCAVLDSTNSSGLSISGEAPLVAVYTNCTEAGVQAQSIAYSVDDGETWRQYPGNPVIPNPGVKDFRDPKVCWHPPSSKWVLTLAANDHVEFYTSRNLKDWELSFRFGQQHGSHAGVWECPDLFELKTAAGKTQWVLIVSVSGEYSGRDETVQYFIGDFDGTQFTPQHHQELWLDYGPDNYAAVTWDGMPGDDGRRILIGWMNSWRYAKEVPTKPWSGHMTLPREIRLVDGRDGFELASLPVKEIENLRTGSLTIEPAPIDSPEVEELFASLSPELLDMQLEFSWAEAADPVCGVRFSNQAGEEALILLDRAAGRLIVDRDSVGRQLANPKFAGRFHAPLRPLQRTLDLRIIKDCSSVEVFADGGRSVISANLFCDAPFDKVSVLGGANLRIRGQVSVLRSIWKTR